MTGHLDQAVRRAGEADDDAWTAVSVLLTGGFKVDAAIGQQVVHNPKGAHALGAFLDDMAAALDRAVARGPDPLPDDARGGARTGHYGQIFPPAPDAQDGRTTMQIFLSASKARDTLILLKRLSEKTRKTRREEVLLQAAERLRKIQRFLPTFAQDGRQIHFGVAETALLAASTPSTAARLSRAATRSPSPRPSLTASSPSPNRTAAQDP